MDEFWELFQLVKNRFGLRLHMKADMKEMTIELIQDNHVVVKAKGSEEEAYLRAFLDLQMWLEMKTNEKVMDLDISNYYYSCRRKGRRPSRRTVQIGEV